MAATGSGDLAMVEKFFTIRKTVIEMLLDRGYLVSENEVKLDFNEFQQKLETAAYKYAPWVRNHPWNCASISTRPPTDIYTFCAIPLGRVTMMSSIHQKKTDSTDKIAVFYSDDGSGTKGLSVSYFEECVLHATAISLYTYQYG
jgi:hypothetical protein